MPVHDKGAVHIHGPQDDGESGEAVDEENDRPHVCTFEEIAGARGSAAARCRLALRWRITV